MMVAWCGLWPLRTLLSLLNTYPYPRQLGKINKRRIHPDMSHDGQHSPTFLNWIASTETQDVGDAEEIQGSAESAFATALQGT
jgi:hypothetical protein